MEDQRLVLITWRDILQCSGWEKADDVEAPQFISLGWLVSRDGKQIKIASTLDYADAFGDAKAEAKPVPYGITAFPTGCVDDIKFLTLNLPPQENEERYPVAEEAQHQDHYTSPDAPPDLSLD